MKTKNVRLNTEYSFENNIVRVIRRNRNSWVEKWQIGWSNKYQKINHQEQTSFLLDNDKIVFASDLTEIKDYPIR